jgi:hypothetical protein
LQTSATARLQARGGQQRHQRTGVQGAVPVDDFDKALSVLKAAIDARQAGDSFSFLMAAGITSRKAADRYSRSGDGVTIGLSIHGLAIHNVHTREGPPPKRLSAARFHAALQADVLRI